MEDMGVCDLEKGAKPVDKASGQFGSALTRTIDQSIYIPEKRQLIHKKRKKKQLTGGGD